MEEVTGKGNGKHTGVAPLIRRMAMDYPELGTRQIAQRVGCNPANVHRVLKRFLRDTDTVESLREYQENKADVFDSLQMRMVASITQDRIEKAPLLPLVTAAAILEDKARTIRGQATGISVNVLMDVAQAIRNQDRGS